MTTGSWQGNWRGCISLSERPKLDGETVVGIIPARGGSKGLPKKNIRPLGGRPLIAHTISSALQSKVLDKLMVSTDSLEIAALASRCGAEVPFLRPASLSTDTAQIWDVVEHALDFFWRMTNVKSTIAVLLFPTAPFRRSSLISRAVRAVAGGMTVGTAFGRVTLDTTNLFYFSGGAYHRVQDFLQRGIESVELRKSICSFSAIRIFPEVDWSVPGWFSGYMTELSKKNGRWGECRTHIDDLDSWECLDINTTLDISLGEEILRRGLYDPA
jgi:CMP-N-acetylneuraminic acid synthetase